MSIIKIENNKMIKMEKESSKLRIGGGSWTINLDKVNLDDINEIEYLTHKSRYNISKDAALSKGFYRTFQGERKLVVPLKHWSEVRHNG